MTRQERQTRDAQIIKLRREGWLLDQLGLQFKLSQARICQIAMQAKRAYVDPDRVIA